MILNLQGMEIKTLPAQNESDGWQKSVWDGTDNRGNNVATGSYLVVAISAKTLQSRIVIKN